MMFDYTGKNICVTGGGRGIGKSIAEAFADAGANVYIGCRNETQGLNVVSSLIEKGVEAGFSRCDVSNGSQVEKLIKDAVSFGGGSIDVIIHAAGIIATDDMLYISEEDIRQLFEVNVFGCSHILCHGMKAMIPKHCGSIITISSIAALINSDILQHYGATKAAMLSLTKSAAKRAAPYGIRINSIAPGIVRTSMWEDILDGMESDFRGKEGANRERTEEREALWQNSIKEMIPLGYPQTEMDIAYAALYLASSYACSITGQVLTVDGGMTLR